VEWRTVEETIGCRQGPGLPQETDRVLVVGTVNDKRHGHIFAVAFTLLNYDSYDT
jgi:hypothetical protein